MQFKYSFQEANNDKIPMIDVRITNKDNGKAINYRAMLDSGSFGNVFHSEVADVLGIDLASIKDTCYFGGVKSSKRLIKGKPYVVELMISGKGNNHKFDAIVIFSDEISQDGFALLGRQNFFDQFDEVCFNYKNNKFYLIKE